MEADRVVLMAKTTDTAPRPAYSAVSPSKQRGYCKHPSARRSKMKRPFRFNKLMAVLTSSGLLLLVLAATGLANSSSVSVTPCDPSVSTCVDVFQPVIRNIEKRTGPSVVDATNSFHTLITMTNIPNGFYKIEANGV